MLGIELFGEEEKKEINDVLTTDILFRYNHDQQREGIWKAKDFESEVERLGKVSYVHAVSSSTAAVSCALVAVGNDEVIAPSFAYTATIEALLSCRGIPVFAEIDETHWSRLPDSEGGDSATFLNMLLLDEALSRKVVEELQREGIGGANYWHTNNYHFINQWNHLKKMQTAAFLPIYISVHILNHQQFWTTFSQYIIDRLISFGVHIKWTEDETDEHGDKIAMVIKKVITHAA